MLQSQTSEQLNNSSLTDEETHDWRGYCQRWLSNLHTFSFILSASSFPELERVLLCKFVLPLSLPPFFFPPSFPFLLFLFFLYFSPSVSLFNLYTQTRRATVCQKLHRCSTIHSILSTLWNRNHYHQPHSEKRAETERGSVTCPRSNSLSMSFKHWNVK